MSAGSLRLNYFALSDQGLVRTNNEDSAFAAPNLLALADGMGGHAAGEVASQLMITHLESLNVDPQDADMLEMLREAAAKANESIFTEVEERPETQGMGTTLTALMFNGEALALCHVGDSRGYRLRDGKLEQITTDDTYVQSLVEKGELDPEDISTHPQRSLILKAYTGRPVEPTLELIDALPGDRLLLCSDGLSDPVTAQTIQETLSEGTPEDAAVRLVELALRSGGPDNVTVVVADVVDGGDLPEDQVEALPVEPAIAGALLGEIDAPTHPETPAGRAAALQRVAKPEAEEEPESEPEEEAPSPEGHEKRSRSLGGWITIILALVVLIGLIFGGWWFVRRGADTYHVASTDGSITVQRGFNATILGMDLDSTYQLACLDRSGSVRLSDVDDDNLPADSDCTPFKTEDLPQSSRERLGNLPSGSYEEITQQIRRLADNALPVCPTREHDQSVGEPGVSCREVSKK